MKRRAFTLIELLVVIAILGLLAAILFPVFAHVRENGRRTVCLSNERQIGMAMLQYVADADETFPQGWAEHSGLGWAGKCYPYVKNLAVYVCPTDPTMGVGSIFDACSYGLNSNLSGYYLPGGSSQAPLSKPSLSLPSLSSSQRTVLLFEIAGSIIPLPLTETENNSASGNGFDEGEGMNGMTLPDSYGPLYATGLIGGRVADKKTQAGSNTPRHIGGANYLACDGHVIWLRPEQVSGGQSQPVGGPHCGQDDTAAGCGGKYTAAGTGNSRYTLTFSIH